MKVSPLPAPHIGDLFGAVVEGYEEADFPKLRELVFSRLVVVVKHQSQLTPQAQYALTKAFDPEAETYGHGHNQSLLAASVLQNDLVSIPSQPQVKVIGHGLVEDHEGLQRVQLKHPQHHSFHKHVLSPEEDSAGFTRFYRWHMDAALYGTSNEEVNFACSMVTLLSTRLPPSHGHDIIGR